MGDILGGYLGSLRLRGKSRTIHQTGLHAGRLEAFYGATFNATALTARGGLRRVREAAPRRGRLARNDQRGAPRIACRAGY